MIARGPLWARLGVGARYHLAPSSAASSLRCSSSMQRDWRAAISNALAMLKPGGALGVVDFYVSPRRADPGMVQHGALARALWPRWFAHDGVHPNAEHLPTLRAMLPAHEIVEARAPVPYLPLARVPYYRFVGLKS